MKQVRIADLKARLSEHLRAVRAGESIAVLDRDTPVAELVPVRASRVLRVQRPAPGALPLHRVKIPKRPPVSPDVVQLLLERASHPMPTELGTLDAIHLSTALLWKDMTKVDLVMATHDGALALGAQAHGLRVVGSPLS